MQALKAGNLSELSPHSCMSLYTGKLHHYAAPLAIFSAGAHSVYPTRTTGN